MAGGSRANKSKGFLPLVALVLVALSSAAWMAAAGEKAAPVVRSYTFKVPTTAVDPDLRVRLAAPSLQAAERVQAELSRVPVALRSTLGSSFRSLDIDLGGSEPSRALVEGALWGRSSVERVERCPCPQEPDAASTAQVSEFVHWRQRSCSTSRRPVAVEACVTEFVASPHKGPNVGKIYLYVFGARAAGGTVAVAKLVAHLTTTGSSQMVESSPPNGDYVLTAGHTEMLVRLFEYPTGRWSYEDKDAPFSKGRLEVGGLTDVFDMALVPTEPRAQLKGATRVVVKPPEKPSLSYSVIVEARHQ